MSQHQMEEERNNNNNDTRKRTRDDDSEADSPESKILRVNSASSDDNSSESQLTRVNSGGSYVESNEAELVRVEPDESVLDSSGVSEIQDELLNILEDTENVTERDPTVHGLDSFIKSFEEEILAPGQDSVDPNHVPESGNFNPNLGYLLEASDDELGLPPTVELGEEGKPESDEPGRVGPEGLDLTGFLGFEDEIRSYEDMGFGNGVFVDYEGGDNGGYVTIDGLFDYAEPNDILWRSKSLQAM